MGAVVPAALMKLPHKKPSMALSLTAAGAVKLDPALSLYSSLIQVKRLKKGGYVGYDQAYRAGRDEWVGTVPIGYADGWSQSLRHSQMIK